MVSVILDNLAAGRALAEIAHGCPLVHSADVTAAEGALPLWSSAQGRSGFLYCHAWVR